MTEYNVALLQALVLYNAPYFLSEDENERSLAGMFLGTIVNVSDLIDLSHLQVDLLRSLGKSAFTTTSWNISRRRSSTPKNRTHPTISTCIGAGGSNLRPAVAPHISFITSTQYLRSR